MLDLSIIIVTWNCKEYALNCLHSIFENPIICSYEIIVIDNNSSDMTVNAIQEEYPKVSIIKNSENKGFASANNQGIKQSSGRYILLLNPDTLVHKNSFDSMVQYLDEHPKIAALGPKILNEDGSQQFTGIRFPNNSNLFFETFFLDRIFPRSRIYGKHKSLFEDYTKPFNIDYAQGSALLLRRSVLDVVGLLDENYFMYFEETDLCYRIRKRGYDIMYFPGSSITHFGGEEEGHFTEKRLLYYHKSLVQFYHKNYSRPSVFILKIIIMFRSALRIILWSMLLVFKPQIRDRARSIIIGYSKTIFLNF